MNANLKQLSQRTQSYWWIDGLAEIAIGFLFLLLSLVFYAQARFAGSPTSFLIILSLPVVIIAWGRLGGRIVQRLKTSLTYPRTGYVAYARSSPRRRKVVLAIGLSITFGLILLMSLSGEGLSAWMALLDGMLLGFVLLVAAPGLLRFYLLAAASLLCGLLISLAGVAGNLANAAFYAGMGLLLAISGLLTLASYLRQAPTRPEA